MKHYIYILLFTVFTLSSCSLNSEGNTDTDSPQIIRIEWHLTHVFGGNPGVNYNFELNDIIWVFDEEYSALIVDNTNNDNTLEDGFDSGTYNFKIEVKDGDEFLFVDNNEFGFITIYPNDNEMTIDQNITINGNAADGYLYTFKRVVIYEE